jgi:hypothetical protein
MSDGKTYRSNYYKTPFTWIKRSAIFIIFVSLVIAWETAEDPWNFWWIKYAIFIFLSLGLIFSPVDDLMVDEQHLFHFKTSLWNGRSRVFKYEIANILAIRCTGVHERGLTLSEYFSQRGTGTDTNTIEITFKDGSYKSLEVAIYKKELIFYTSKVRERMSLA